MEGITSLAVPWPKFMVTPNHRKGWEMKQGAQEEEETANIGEHKQPFPQQVLT